jgi:hypothetical protein
MKYPDQKPHGPGAWDALPDAPNAVTVFGAGIAGLTVAHELVERGFQVQVWECQGDDRAPERGCDVGGLARTQWGSVTWPVDQDVAQLSGPEREPPVASEKARAAIRDAIPTVPIRHFPFRFYVRWTVPKLVTEQDQIVTDLPARLKELLESHSVHWLEVTIAQNGVQALSKAERERRLKAAAEALVPLGFDQFEFLSNAHDEIATLRYREHAIKLRLKFEESLDASSATVAIVPLGDAQRALCPPIVLRTRWSCGEITSTIDLSEPSRLVDASILVDLSP